MIKKRGIPRTDKEAYQRLLGSGITKTQLAKMVGIKKQAVTRWSAIPLKYVKAVHEGTGIRKAYLRPSDFA